VISSRARVRGWPMELRRGCGGAVDRPRVEQLGGGAWGRAPVRIWARGSQQRGKRNGGLGPSHVVDLPPEHNRTV
jgi:hypothetical protein